MREPDCGFEITVYEQRQVEDNAWETYGPKRGDRADREQAMKDGLIDGDGKITKKGWDLLNDDIAKLELNSLRWLRKTFGSARDEGHDSSDDLIGTVWFDPLDPTQASLIALATDNERIDMVDTSYGDLGDSAFDGVSEFGGRILGGQITFFDVKPEDMEVIEQTLEVERRRSPSAREVRRRPHRQVRAPWQRGFRVPQGAAEAKRRPSRGDQYDVRASGSMLYSGPDRREAEDVFDDAAHKNYEGTRYVDDEIELLKNGQLVRSFGPNDPRPRYFHPLPQWADKGLVDESRRRRPPAPARPTRRRSPARRR